MIPKIIHYCWFGGKSLPADAIKCIESWKKNLQGYQIIEWNENNFDVNISKYCKEAYQAKKWAFVSDYVRVYVLYHYGGIYMDTDVEVIKPFEDEFLENEAFSGYETPKSIPTGIMASEKGQAFFKTLLEFYNNAIFKNDDGSLNIITNVKLITDIAVENGFKPDNKKQTVLGFTLYPQTYFCPLSHDTGVSCISENTYTIHHFAGSWCDYKTKFVGKWHKEYKMRLKEIFGEGVTGYIYKILYNMARFFDFLLKK